MKKYILALTAFFALNVSHANSKYLSVAENMKSLDWAMANGNVRKACYHIGHLATILLTLKFNLLKADHIDFKDKDLTKNPKFDDFYISLVPVLINCDTENKTSELNVERFKKSYEKFNKNYKALLAGGSDD